MLRVGVTLGIIMPAGFGKIFSCTTAAFVNVECKKACVGVGETAYPHLNQHTITLLIEPGLSNQMGMILATVDMGNGIRIDKTMMHNFTSFSAYE